MMHRLTSLNHISGSGLDMWPVYSGYNTWASGQNFTPVQSIEKYWNEKYIEQKEKIYDALNYLQRSNSSYMCTVDSGNSIERSSR